MQLKEIITTSKINFRNALNRLLFSSTILSGGIFTSLATSSNNTVKEILANSILSPIAGIGANILSEKFEETFISEISKEEIIQNDELTNAVGKTIFSIILIESQNREYGVERQILKHIGNMSIEKWRKLIKEENFNKDTFNLLTNEELKELLPENISKYFAPNTDNFSEFSSLSIESWKIIIKLLLENSGFFLRFQSLERLAWKLSNEFPETFRKVLIDDLKQDRKAHSQIQLLLLKEIASNTEETLQLSKQINEKIIDIQSIISNFSKPIPKFIPPNRFPSRLNNFIGRKKTLQELRIVLKKDSRASIIGLNGIGKTSLVLEYAYQNAEIYKFICFIRATPSLFFMDMAICADSVGIISFSDTTIEQKARAFCQWLNEQDNFLLIFDNVKYAREISSYLPSTYKGHILFTSNNNSISNLGNKIDIETMPTNEAELFLYQSATKNFNASYEEIPTKDKPAITKIIQELDFLPLALNLVGAYINNYQISFDQYLESYRKDSHNLLSYQDINDQYANNSIVKTLSLAFEKIATPENSSFEAKQIAETAVLFLKTASFLNPEAIPLEIFTEILNKQSDSAKELSQDELFLDEVFAKIAQFDLFEKDNAKETVNVHRLVLKVINNKIEADEKQTICSQILEILADLMPRYDYGNKETCERYFRQTETALENADKLPLENGNSKILYNRLGYFQQLSGNYQLAEKFHYRNWKISENVYGKEHQETAQGLNELAMVYYSQGRYAEAIENYEEALKIGEKTIGKEHPDYASGLNNLANVYYSQGRYAEAIEKFEEALKIAEKTIGKEHPDYASGLNNLAGVHYSQGRYAEAIENYEEALKIDEKTIGKEHPEYATRLNNSGNVYREQGKYAEAIEKYKEALKIDEKTIGKEHPDYATRLNNLALVYNLQGRYAEAIEKLEETLKIDEKTIGKEHPQYANHLNNLALVYYSQSRYAEAIPLYEEALRIMVKVFGENHPSTQRVKGNLENCRNLAKGE